MRRCRGFTLIEISLVVFIMLLLLMLAVPSLRGVLGDRRLHRSLNQLNALVRQAQELSVNQRRPFLIILTDREFVLRPENFGKDETKQPTATMPIERGENFQMAFPAALEKNPPPEWIFWPSGTCEVAIVSYQSGAGNWSARYSALTARVELQNYATR